MPVRTCVGCRSRAVRSSLVRVIAKNSRLVVDFSATEPGRGAWIHPSVDCIDRAVRRRAFGRALKCTATLDVVGALHELIGRDDHPESRRSETDLTAKVSIQ